MENEVDGISLEEQCIIRQRKEKKDLQARIQQMKHSVSKGDKKKKKEITAQIAVLEAELNTAHEQELEALRLSAASEVDVTQDLKKLDFQSSSSDAVEAVIDNDLNDGTTESDGNNVKKMSKAQRRKDKKVQKAQEREERIREQDVVNEQGSRNIEAEKLRSILHSQGLILSEVASDGNCLFSAIEDQLRQRGIESNVESLRCQTAQYIRNHRDDFLPFFVKEDSGDLFTSEEFENYCDRLEKTPEWGGQAEIRALTEVLKTPVEVIQADGPTITVGENFQSKPLTIVYHRHQFGLGAHYNSVRSGATSNSSSSNS